VQWLQVPTDPHVLIAFDDARSLVAAVLAEMEPRARTELVIDDRETRAEDWCWVFFYNSRAYVEDGDVIKALAGNGPIVVEKATGRVHVLQTATPVDEQLARLRS
jgi:hypothetical protein